VTYVLEKTQRVPAPLDEVFDFFARPDNLARITPGWLDFRIVAPEQRDMRQGLEIEYRVRPLLVPQKWVSRITAYDPPHRFVDEQVHGPYRRWRHLHEFEPVATGNGAVTEIRDRVDYALPFGPLGRVAHALLVRRQLESIFEHRRRVIADEFGAA